MNPSYQFSLDLLSLVATLLFATGLAIYGWYRRAVPGAMPFAILMACEALWVIGGALEAIAPDAPTKILGYKLQTMCIGPMYVTGLCFVVNYARLERWLTRWAWTILWAYLIGGFILIVTDDIHHWIWLSFTVDNGVHFERAWANLVLNLVGLCFALLNLPILIWLFIRSPQQRLPVAFMLCGQIVVRLAYLLVALDSEPFVPIDFNILAANFSSAMYAIALFGFRIFDPIPMARRTVIEQMREAMIVLDTHWHIVDLNPAAEHILQIRALHVKGRPATQVLPASLNASMPTSSSDNAPSEITLGDGNDARTFLLDLTPLKDARDFALGYLMLLRDVSEQKQTQTQLLNQQRALATLQEREHLARELHDGLAQVLSYASLELEATHKLLDDGQAVMAQGQIARLAGIVREAHADVREHILNLAIAPAVPEAFFPTLEKYLAGFTQNYGIATRLTLDANLPPNAFDPEAQAQLFRIIQEALTNARKHARARSIQIRFEWDGNCARVIIQDDGRGFDLAHIGDEGRNRFGLQFMRQRAEQLSGSLIIDSAPGAGTRVIVQVPVVNSRTVKQ